MKLNSKQIISSIASMKITAALLLVFAFAVGTATFIENDFGTETARALVYNAVWFELLIALLGFNLCFSIVHYKLWRREKLPLFLYHLSFLVIFIGAGITRHFGFEGSMHIREGFASNEILSERATITASVDGSTDEKNLILSSISSNRFRLNPDPDVSIAYRDYYADAAEVLMDTPDGRPAIHFMISASQSGNDVILLEGESFDAGSLIVDFATGRRYEKPVIEIRMTKSGDLQIRSPQPVRWMRMADQVAGSMTAGAFVPFERGKLHTTAGLNLVLKDAKLKGARSVVRARQKTQISALVVDVVVGGATRTVTLTGGKGIPIEPVMVEVGSRSVTLGFGSRVIPLPFSLHLKDFIVERYPGSNSPSSYESRVLLIDPEMNLHEESRIYMNHILKHRGYRFYQSSYDPDESGTILTVSHDPGMIPTYVGYFMLIAGFLINIFNGKARLGRLEKMIRRDDRKEVFPSYLAPFLFVAASFFSAGGSLRAQPVDAPEPGVIDTRHAELFARLPVQDVQGRIKPMDSLTMELLSKLARERTMYGMSYNQIVLGMISDPEGWSNRAIIKVSDPELKRIIGIGANKTHASFSDFFDSRRKEPYKIGEFVNAAMRKRESERTQFDKAVIKTDEMANICFMVFRGDLFRIFPIPNDPSYKWASPLEMVNADPAVRDEAQRLYSEYAATVKSAASTGEWEMADANLNRIVELQRRFSVEHYPSDSSLSAEIAFNRLNIFDRLSALYALAGFLMLALAFIEIVYGRAFHPWIFRSSAIVVFAAFLAHTAGLGLRWYISGHEPWSNGYESLIYIAWTVVLAGLIFGRHSLLVLATAAIMSGLTLFVAHMSWMDPQITNLVPVLKSYWLTIHVSVISASYGFLAIGALLGFIVMILMIFRNPHKPRIDAAIRSMIRIDEMSLLLGIALLSIGNLLGAIWANESWGRYWSWDPKETWTLVSILVYAAVLHLRYIPALNSVFVFAAASTWSYAAILMTYFGVNYFLSGLHSYAAGDPVPVPDFVYYVIAIVLFVMILAHGKRDSKIPLNFEG